MTSQTVQTNVEKPAKLARVKLIGNDGNAFAILGACKTAARKAGYTPEQISAWQKEARSGNYDHLLATCCDWFDVR